MSAVKFPAADDVTRIDVTTLIDLHRHARTLSLTSNRIRARMSGQYVSAFRGRGMEFDEARPYQPGDDIRSIDWRVTARTGRTHTKLFREERERPVLLWVDFRRSMFFGTRNYFKSVLAARIAGLLAWTTAQQGDRLGGLVFSDQVHHELRPQRGQSATLHFLQQLAEHPAWAQGVQQQPDPGSGMRALLRLRRVARPGSLIFLLSDFRDMRDDIQSHLAQLKRHNDVVMLFINDPLERELPPAGLYRVSDGKRELDINSRDKHHRQRYRQRFAQHRQTLQQQCQKLGVYFIDISTEDDMLYKLQSELGRVTGR